MIDVIIIGCGPAGMSAALYLQRAGMSVTIFGGSDYGGQMAKAPLIENYPGFSGSGADLAEAMLNQIEGKVDVNFDRVVNIYKNDDFISVVTESGEIYHSTYLIIATGGKPIVPFIDGIDRKNVHYCAVCDGALYKDKKVAVIGGGNSALQYAVELSDIAKEVHIVALFDHLAGEQVWLDRVNDIDNIYVHCSFDTVEITKDRIFSANGEEIAVDGVFVAIGYNPNTPNLSNINVKTTVAGFIIVNAAMETSEPRVYAVGDVVTKFWRQVASAVNDGMVAALNIISLRKA